MKAQSVIRTVYLYLFAFVGLILLVISGVRFLDMGLKAFVFTEAEREQRLWQSQPPYPGFDLDKVADLTEGGDLESEEVITLTEDEKARVDAWLARYNEWAEERESVDPITAQRHREAASSLAMLFAGFPLYLYHWREIKREVKSS